MGNVNKAASIAGSAIVFGGALSAAQCIGLLATLGGAFAFAEGSSGAGGGGARAGSGIGIGCCGGIGIG